MSSIFTWLRTFLGLDSLDLLSPARRTIKEHWMTSLSPKMCWWCLAPCHLSHWRSPGSHQQESMRTRAGVVHKVLFNVLWRYSLSIKWSNLPFSPDSAQTCAPRLPALHCTPALCKTRFPRRLFPNCTFSSHHASHKQDLEGWQPGAWFPSYHLLKLLLTLGQKDRFRVNFVSRIQRWDSF